MAFRSSSQLTGANGTSAAVPVPTGATSGDIAVVGLYLESTASITTVPSGFTLKSDLQTSAGSRGRLAVYWKRLTAGDAGTYTFSWSGSTWRAGVCGLWSGRVASGDPFDGTVGTAESTTAVTTLNVSTSPTGSGGDAAGFWTNFQGGNSYTPPTNYTERQDIDVITIDTRDAVASGSTGSISATSNVSGFQKAFLGVIAVASSGFTGTAAVTQDSQTSSASGQLGYSGTSGVTQANQTSSASGTATDPPTGSAAVTQAAQTSTASGQLGYSGASAASQANQTSSATGQLGYSGTSATTQANQTSSAAGQLGYTGTSATTQSNQTSTASGSFTAGGSFSGTSATTQSNQAGSAAGQLGYSGSLTVVQAANTSSASGTVINPITGTAATTQANQTSAATGQLGYSGTSAATQANQTSTASGAVVNPVTGTASTTQASQTSTAAGVFAALVSFGTAHAAVGQAAAASAAAASTPAASSGSMTVPTATGG